MLERVRAIYKSPIEVICSQMQTQVEDNIVRTVQNYGINVDKEELIKALTYDRNQYDVGYRDALASVVRCKDCKHCTIYRCRADNGIKQLRCEFGLDIGDENHYCSCGERKDGDDK